MPALDTEDSASLPCASGQGPGIQPGLRAQIPAPLLSGCVTPGKPLDFSEPQVPHVENGPGKALLGRTAGGLKPTSVSLLASTPLRTQADPIARPKPPREAHGQLLPAPAPAEA